MNMHVDMDAAPRPSHSRNSVMRPLAVALDGVGSHGAFGWGVLDRLIEDGRIDIDAIAATGAGALNAVVYADGLLKGGRDGAREALDDFWRMTSEAPGWPACWVEQATRVLSPYEFNPLNLDPERGILESTFDFGALARSRRISLFLAATHVRSGTRRVFKGRKITADAVMASACQPALSQAVEIDGELYWDGLYSGGPALGALAAGADAGDVLVTRIAAAARRAAPRRAADIQARMAEIAVQAALQREICALSSCGSGTKHVHAIRSDDVMSDLTPESRFDTRRRFLVKLRDAGRLAAELWLDAHFDDLSLRSTVDLI